MITKTNIGVVIIVLFALILISGCVEDKCGDGICSKDETKISCPGDCDEITCRELYKTTEEGCLKNGWNKLYVDVKGIQRELLWKQPASFDNSSTWENGVIIVLHGGEGTYSTFCYPVPEEHNRFLSDIFRGTPAAEFGELAIEEGFAVFSLNSAYNRATDSQGLSIGKRWDSLMQDDKENIDLMFIETVIIEIIPNLRPTNSKNDIFMTGISNGGFMTTLAATHFTNKISAFAPVSSGDPYGMYFDMGTNHLFKRKCGPGTWRDLETNKEIQELDSCKSNTYPNEKEWPPITRSIIFKQFYHEGDGGVHISCMEKTRKLLVEQGYRDAGAFIISAEKGKRGLEEHFWQQEYNQPILDFFKNY